MGTGAGGGRRAAVLAWRQILRAVPQDVDLPALARDHRLTAELARPAPDLFPGEHDEADGPRTAEDRFQLFDAVDRLLRLLSRHRLLLIVLDDAHWTDDSSLRLLQDLADSMSAQRLLLVVNFRDTEPLGDVLLTGLARGSAARTLELRGLSLPDVGAQLASLMGEQVSDQDVRPCECGAPAHRRRPGRRPRGGATSSRRAAGRSG